MNELRRVFCAVAIVFLAGCQERREFRTRLVREWPADEISEVKLRGINGKVKLEGDPSGKVSLVAEIRASGRPAREALERGLIETHLEGERLEIREKTLSKKVIEFVPLFNTGRVRISYLLKVPESTDVTVSTMNGKIETTGVSGFLTLETVNGPIIVETPRAQLDAKTVNGSIRAAFTEEFRGAQLRTVNGAIRLTVPPGASIDAQIDQVNGAFRTNIPVNVHSSSGHREASGELDGGEFPLEVSTVNGSVSLLRRDIEAPDQPSAPALPPVPPAPPAPAAPART